MATYQTVIAEKQLALADRTGLPTVPQLAAIHTGAGVHVATAEFIMPASLAADDLAHIALGDPDLKDGLALGFALGHGDLVGILDETLYDVGQKFFHRLVAAP